MLQLQQTVVAERLNVALVENEPSLINCKDVMFQHDNVQQNTSNITFEKSRDFFFIFQNLLHLAPCIQEFIQPSCKKNGT